ncbi:hypothetical protein ACSBPQ_14850 [Stenotrophomonas sp. JC08]|uniref:hypothetical protein n=1 Tax=Stenotrophomonas sp. JC08 TaxID=3445779 RepID=UPI003FA315CF
MRSTTRIRSSAFISLHSAAGLAASISDAHATVATTTGNDGHVSSQVEIRLLVHDRVSAEPISVWCSPAQATPK